MPRRIVITGVGVISPLGQTAQEHFDALMAGLCGISPITAFDIGDFPVRFAGQIRDFKASSFLKNRKALKMMARDIQLSVAAASLAARDGGVYDGTKDPARFGVSMGAPGFIPTDVDEMGAAVAHSLDENGRFDIRKFGREGIENLFPLWLLKYLPNMLNSHIAIEYDAQGPNNCLTSGNSGGILAIGEAARVIERGQADMMLAGAAESRIHPLALVRLYLEGKLSEAADLPERGTRPMCKGRSGMAASEGGAAVIIEEEANALARGARIYARVAGFGSSCGGQLIEEVSPDGRGAREAMRKALSDAGLCGADIDCVFANASGLAEDAVEAAAIAEVVGAGKAVVATRGSMGHMMCASGAADVVVAALAISRGAVPGTFGAREPEELPVRILKEPLAGEFGAIMVNAFSFGGQTASLVITRY